MCMVSHLLWAKLRIWDILFIDVLCDVFMDGGDRTKDRHGFGIDIVCVGGQALLLTCSANKQACGDMSSLLRILNRAFDAVCMHTRRMTCILLTLP